MNDVRSPAPRRPSALLVLLVCAALAGPGGAPPLRAVQAEYASLLALGRAAYDRRDYPLAIRNLRLACFGMLDEPKALADCLARLALAQDKANDLEGFQLTFQRLVEVEERFSAYTQGELAPELRSALEPRIVARVPAATLEGSAGFRFLVAKKADALAATLGKGGVKPVPPSRTGGAPAAKPSPSPPPPVTKEVANPKPAGPVPPPAKPPQTGTAPPAAGTNPPTTAAAPPPTGTPANPAGNALQTAPQPARPLTEVDREKIQQSREKLGSERTAKELRSIFDTVKAVADAHPDSREAQHVVGQAAYRLSRWPEAVSYFKRGGDPGDDQAELLFYLAVSLYESGDASGAAAALRRSLPNLRRTPYVDQYTKKILGQ